MRECLQYPEFNEVQFERICRVIAQGLTDEFNKFPKPDQESKFSIICGNISYCTVETLIKERDDV